jgi:hypothetical protein
MGCPSAPRAGSPSTRGRVPRLAREADSRGRPGDARGRRRRRPEGADGRGAAPRGARRGGGRGARPLGAPRAARDRGVHARGVRPHRPGAPRAPARAARRRGPGASARARPRSTGSSRCRTRSTRCCPCSASSPTTTGSPRGSPRSRRRRRRPRRDVGPRRRPDPAGDRARGGRRVAPRAGGGVRDRLRAEVDAHPLAVGGPLPALSADLGEPGPWRTIACPTCGASWTRSPTRGCARSR